MTDEADFRMTHQGGTLEPCEDVPLGIYSARLRAQRLQIEELQTKLQAALDALRRAQRLHRDKWIFDLLAQLEGENGGKT